MPARFHDRTFWKLGTEVNIKRLISQNISALSIAVKSPVIISGFAVLTKFHESMRLDTKSQTKLGRTIPFTYQVNSFLFQASMKLHREGF